MRPIDIGPADLETIRHSLHKHTHGLEVRAFGSRVSWTARETSDLDLALMTDEPLSIARMAALRAAFTASDLPFRVDLVDWASTSETFRKVIEAEHVLLVKRDNSVFASNVWVSLRLGAVCTKIGSGATPRGGKDVYLKGGRFSLIRSQNIYNDGFRHDGLAFITQHQATALNNVEVRSDDVLLNITGDSVARACQVAPDVLPARVNQHVAIIRPDSRKLSARFLRYFLVHPKLQAMLLSWAGSGGTRNALTKSMIESFRVYAPADVAEQRAIGYILGTLDDKIELNRRMNATLEAMARALFTSWFVDFDHVRAKMEGRDTGLPKDIADMFPDRLVDSELGEIPEGWPVESLADHFEAVKGVSYKGSGLGGGGVPLHNLNSVHEGGGYKYEGIKFYSGEYADRHRVRSGDVIVANTEQGHDRLLIGYAAIVPVSFGTDGIASHHIYRLRSRRVSWLSTRFLLFLLNSPRMHDLVSGYANGTTVNMLPLDGVQRPPVAVPPRALVETFDVVASCSEHRREQTVRESRTLTDLRNTLLPKLVSGELRVNALEAAFGRGDRPVSVAVQEA